MIEINEISLIPKDKITISKSKDFLKIYKTYGFEQIYYKKYDHSNEFTEYFYLIGTEVVYIYEEKTYK
ncbi:hypothetical protein KKG81_04850 [bacterium]|nr:hypothetical protein [bacterium]